jgi:hypothetical protein
VKLQDFSSEHTRNMQFNQTPVRLITSPCE